MKTVLLAGGFGTRIEEYSHLKPKPMIEVGGMPILWHIMRHYSYYGHNEFIICAGYRQDYIKEWFANYFLRCSDITFDYTGGRNEIVVHRSGIEKWKVTIVDTGLNTMTGGRIKRVRDYLEDEPFMMTYGDALCDVDINKLISYHQSHGKIATLTAVRQIEMKGVIDIDGDNAVKSFREKNMKDGNIINAGFMVLNPEIFDYISDDACVFERHSLPKLAEERQIMSYVYDGFWQCVDTVRDKQLLEKILDKNRFPWMK